jgi:hypothetical protein
LKAATKKSRLIDFAVASRVLKELLLACSRASSSDRRSIALAATFEKISIVWAFFAAIRDPRLAGEGLCAGKLFLLAGLADVEILLGRAEECSEGMYLDFVRGCCRSDAHYQWLRGRGRGNRLHKRWKELYANK